MTEGICIPLVAKPEMLPSVVVVVVVVVGLHMIMLALSCTLPLLLGTIH